MTPKMNPDYVTGATLSPEKIEWMEQHVPKSPGVALDLGCGAGFYSTWLQKQGWKVYAVDIAQPPALEDIQTLSHDLEKGIPFESEFFDLILAWDVIEHIEKEKHIWSELSSALKPKGTLLGSVPHQSN